MRNPKVAGAISGPVLAFLGVLAIGLAVAAYFFVPKFQEALKNRDAANQEVAEAQNRAEPRPETSNADGASPNASVAQQDASNAKPMTAAPDPAGGDKTSPYITDSVLVSDLSSKLKGGDITGFLALAGEEQVTALNKLRLKNLLVDHKFAVDTEQPQVELSSSGTGKTWGINLNPPPEKRQLGKQQIRVDLANTQNRGWNLVGLNVPDIEAVIASLNGEGSAAMAGADSGVKPIEIARDFFNAVLSRNFRQAKSHVDSDRLTDEKLAALFIVVEEGEFKPHSKNALVATANQERNAWIIARLESAEKESDFGIEMERKAGAEPWKVVGLNFSKLIQAQVAELGAGDIAYTPIKKNLRGGDSLVLYFEYDESGVNPRASRQLKIIADILRQDPKRQLHIGGHADAMGTEDYNEDLSQSRAQNVRTSLISLGIPASQIVSKGFGESTPKAPNLNPDGTDNPSGRAQNRRAEIYLAF